MSYSYSKASIVKKLFVRLFVMFRLLEGLSRRRLREDIFTNGQGDLVVKSTTSSWSESKNGSTSGGQSCLVMEKEDPQKQREQGLYFVINVER